jgi:endonuclease-3
MINNEFRLSSILDILLRHNPDPKTELNYKNNYTLLIAVLLSAQTTDKIVNRATEKLFQIVKTPEDMINLGIEELKKHINIVNFYKNKAQHIIETSDILCKKKYKNYIPDNLEELTSLPGVGRKTANVILNAAFDMDTIAVDTHIFRVTNRIFGLNLQKPDQTEEFLMDISKNESRRKYIHHILILHGRYICKAIKPNCKDCKVRDLCCFASKC